MTTNPIDARLSLLRTDEGIAAMRKATRDSIGGSRLSRVRAWMHETDARCVSCGLVTRTDVPARHPRHAELGHLIAACTYAASNARVGFLPTNIGLMCHTCNADANKAGKSFTSADLIADAWIPAAWSYGASHTADDTLADESRMARSW